MKQPNYPSTQCAAMIDHYEFLLEMAKTREQKEVCSQQLKYWLTELEMHK